MSRVYKIDFGIEGAHIDNPLDDVFEVEIEFSEEEHDQMLIGYEKLFWDDDDLAQLFRDYLPELNEKICDLAEPFAVAKWGEVAKRENGAWYEAFPPDEIVDEYMASDNYKEFCDAQERMQTNCKKQSEYEVHVLKEGLRQGRWPHFTDAGPYHLFDCFRATGGMEAYYCMNGRCNGLRIEYCKRYKLRGSKMEIEFYGPSNYAKKLIDEYLMTCGREIDVRSMGYKYLVYVPAKEDATDIEILLPILDRMEEDANRAGR